MRKEVYIPTAESPYASARRHFGFSNLLKALLVSGNFTNSRIMLKLTDIDIWTKLKSPFENSGDIPVLIEQLEKTYSDKTLDIICWEYIYHQKSLYESTFATFPYLVNFCETATDASFKLNAFINLGLILSELDTGDILLTQAFANSKLDKEVIKSITESFKESFQKLKEIGKSLFEIVVKKNETEKRYFLNAIAVANENFKVAKLFSTFTENDEYICSCPECDTDFYLWNKDDRLVLYTADPVFDKKQAGFPVVPKSSEDIQPSEIISSDNNFEWLTFYIDKLKIDSLKSIINYLFGEIKCPECTKKFNVFNAILDPLT